MAEQAHQVIRQHNTPKINGMVGRANGIIKTNTILREQYAFEAVEKWYELKPEIFKETIFSFKGKIVLLQHQTNSKQICFTQ